MSVLCRLVLLFSFLSLSAQASETAQATGDVLRLTPARASILRLKTPVPADPRTWAALPESSFKALEGKNLWLGWKPGRVLLRVPVIAPEAGKWWMQVEYPGLDSVRVENAGEISGWIGDDIPRSRWTTPWHGFYQPVTLHKGLNLVHVEVMGTHGRLGLILNLRKEATHQRLMEDQALRDGLFLGLLIANFLFAFWLWRVERRPAHMWYLLYLASATLFVFAYHHRGFAWVWSAVPICNHFDRTSTSIATFGIVSMFLHELLGFRQLFPKVARILRGMAWALLFCAAIQFLYPLDSRVFEWVYGIGRIEVLELSTYLLALALTARLAWRGDRLAAWVLVAMSPMIAALAIAMFAEVLRLPWMYEHRGMVVEIGLVIENFALTWLLIRRVVQERRDHQALVEKHLALELDFSRRLAQETDRNLRDTALDLHDGVGQELAGMSVYLHSVLRGNADPRLTESVSREMGRVMEVLRRTAHRIYPPELMEGGLRLALERLARSLTSKGLVVRVEGDIPDPGEEAALHWYRIVQEAIVNAQRHGKAHDIAVRLAPGRVEVDDDGVGCLPGVQDGMGLRSIRLRAKMLGAEATLALSAVGPGMCLTVSVKP